MRKAIYNLAIPKIILKSVDHAFSRASGLRFVFVLAILLWAMAALGADWSAVEQQLAKKIAAVIGPGTVRLSVENRSSLGRRDSDVVQNGLKSALEQSGIHLVQAEQASAAVNLTLSENETSYVWVAEIHQGAAEPAVVMVSVPRSGRSPTHESMPIALRKTAIWTQDDRMLDLAVLEENGSPSRIAVLGAENVSVYRIQNGKWQLEMTMPITHARPWPVDVRGRLVLAFDRTLSAYLPGVLCRIPASGATLTITCHASDDPWPIVPTPINASVFPSAGSGAAPSAGVAALAAFFAPTRNYFTGVLSPAVGKVSTVSKFYTAAFVPREKYTLWLFASSDGRVHFVDGTNDQPSSFEWGSEIAALKTPCGAGWQVLATGSGDQAEDSVRAYEFPDRDPVGVSPALDFAGPVSALWTESKGDSAIAISKNRDTGSYEAYRLSLACGQ